MSDFNHNYLTFPWVQIHKNWNSQDSLLFRTNNKEHKWNLIQFLCFISSEATGRLHMQLKAKGVLGLNVCLTLKSICWSPNPQCDGIWRWGLWEGIGHEGGVLMSGISVCIKRNSREIIFLSAKWGYSEKTAICKSWSTSPSDRASANLGLPHL